MASRGRERDYWVEESPTAPLSRAEKLMQAHPDIRVYRDAIGWIRITQTFPDAQSGHDRYKARQIWMDGEVGEADFQRYSSSVTLKSFEHPKDKVVVDDFVFDIRYHGLQTQIKIHVDDGGQVRPEVGYAERHRYPREYWPGYIRLIEAYTQPIPAQEIIATARIGLEMLNAYRKASRAQRYRIDNDIPSYQIVDENKPWMDKPLKRRGDKTYTSIGARSIYALNTLNKVTDAMLPGEMPPPPQNRREPRLRTATPPAPGRRAAGR